MGAEIQHKHNTNESRHYGFGAEILNVPITGGVLCCFGAPLRACGALPRAPDSGCGAPTLGWTGEGRPRPSAAAARSAARTNRLRRGRLPVPIGCGAVGYTYQSVAPRSAARTNRLRRGWLPVPIGCGAVGCPYQSV